VSAPPARPARVGLLAGVGVVLLLPRLVLVWFLGLDVLQVVASLLLFAGLVVLGIALLRLLLARRPSGRLWPVASAGIGCVLLAGVLTAALRPTAVTSTGNGVVAAPVALFQYGWTIVGAVWVVGLVLALGSAVVALQRRR
jgi:hypothetical protein